jgi:hypothetical protein
MSTTFLANFKFFFCRIFLSVAGDHASIQLFSSSGVERVIFFFFSASGQQRYGRAYFELTDSSGDIQVDWVWLFLENMYVKALGNYQNRQFKSQSRVEGFYINPNQSFEFIKAGGDVNVDKLWSYVLINLLNFG